MLKKSIIFTLFTVLLSFPYQSQGMETGHNSERALSASACFAIAAGAHCLYAFVKYLATPDTHLHTLEELKPLTLTTRPLPEKDSGLEEFSRDKTRRLFDNKTITGLLSKVILPEPTKLNLQFKLTDQNKVMDIASGISKDLKNHDVVNIVLGGYLTNYGIEICNGRGHFAATLLAEKILQGPIVTFNCASDWRASFNFGQEQDISCLERIYNEILAINPDIKIVFFGGCKGAAVMLRFLEKHANNPEYTKNIKAVITESPPISPKHALEQQSPLSHFLACYLLPNYNYRAPRITDAENFAHVPLLIGCLPIDDVCSIQQIYETIHRLATHCKCPTIHTFVSADRNLKHGQLTKDAKFHDAVRNFINYYANNDEKVNKDEKQSAFIAECKARTEQLCKEHHARLVAQATTTPRRTVRSRPDKSHFLF